MKLIAFLNNWTKAIPYSKCIIVFTSVASILSGVAATMLIAVISSAVSSPGTHVKRLMCEFIALVLITSLLNISSQALMLSLNREAVLHLRSQLCRHILRAPLRKLEETGVDRVLGTLTDDIPTITSTLSIIPGLCTSTATLTALLFYLAWLSFTGFLILIVAVIVGAAGYLAIASKGKHFSKLARDEWDSLLRGYRALTGGIKELKLHQRRQEDFLSQDLDRTSTSLARYRNRESLVYLIAGNWSPLFAFAMIGVMVFGLSRMEGIDTHVLMAFTFGILFIIGPIGSLLGVYPAIIRAKIAMNKIEGLGLSMMQQMPDARETPLPDTSSCWTTLELKGVCHSYFLEHEGRSFELGPIGLRIDPGKLIFIIGGNGSGKTTLVKLLTGLYVPEAGEIYFNDDLIDDGSRDYYRQHFSVVFSDFFLFESLFGLCSPELDETARMYLSKLQLSHKVQIRDGRLSSTELSQGQRKRLALLTAFLEDRPIYVFDEWAADQDPVFKDIFYLHLLPELKARNKTIIVISHDDRYYYLADHIVKLDLGRIVSSQYAPEEVQVTSRT
jgi:putative ATP-binding cassette transporter